MNAPDAADSRTFKPLPPEPLSELAFRAYGDVLEPPPASTLPRCVNEGSAQRHDRIAELANLRPGTATLNVALFRCTPRVLPFPITTLEKHPYSAQLFVPMNASRYVVVVAQDRSGVPDFHSLRAFLAAPNQGVSYGPNVWHHTLIALDSATDFASLVWEDQSATDCIVHIMDAKECCLLQL
jgi:ureidoglycolate lyase